MVTLFHYLLREWPKWCYCNEDDGLQQVEVKIFSIWLRRMYITVQFNESRKGKQDFLKLNIKMRFDEIDYIKTQAVCPNPCWWQWNFSNCVSCLPKLNLIVKHLTAFPIYNSKQIYISKSNADGCESFLQKPICYKPATLTELHPSFKNKRWGQYYFTCIANLQLETNANGDLESLTSISGKMMFVELI